MTSDAPSSARDASPGDNAGSPAVAPLRPRLRIIFEAGRKIGPGKAELLEAIGRTGSISAAGREMNMSYRRAWLLVDEVNRIFTEPVVLASAGGANGGGAQLTEFGREVLAAYRRVEARTEAAIAEELSAFADRLSHE